MNNLKIETVDSVLVVDSRLIADDLGIDHKSFMKNIQKYEQELLTFDQLRFEVATVTNSTGAVNVVKFVYLTEEQATFIMTLSRNTDQVVQCKLDLVKKFSEAKKLLSKPMSPAEMFIYSAQKLKELEERQTEVENKLALQQHILEANELETQANTAELERFRNGHGWYYSIAGFCSLKGIKPSLEWMKQQGRKASAICKIKGINPVPVTDPRWGQVNTYPDTVLIEMDWNYV